MTPARLAGLGAFVIGGILLFAIALFLIGERRMLFADKISVHAEFARVSGLQQGAPVKVSGMAAGEVRDITVPAGPGGRFRVRFDVRKDLHALVRTDSVASIQTEGLVGGTYLSVSTGTAAAAQVADGGTIPSREPFELADLLQQMSETVRTVNETITALRGDVESAVRTVAETAEHADALIEDVSGDIERITEAGRRIAEDASAMVRDVRSGRGTLGKLVTDDELYARIAAISREAQAVVEQTRRAVDDARDAVARLRSKDGPAQGVVADLRQTLGHAREALADLEENTEALKRNWFFRGFFNRRGFFDLDRVSAAEYAAGALERDGRRRVRVWLPAARVFATVADAREEISPDGRAVIDSAMQAYLGYPPDTPLVIEGYAVDGSAIDAHLRSASRAAQVREYLLSRFGRSPQLTGAIALGDRKDGEAPGGGVWDGVAIAAFVQPQRAVR